MLNGSVFDISIVEERQGFIILSVEGERVKQIFRNEPGGHRIQQIPRNERNGRVHTSTITVAVLDVPKNIETILNQRDLEITSTRSSGAGGQNVNKVESCVIIKHIPSGIMIKCQNERSQVQNKRFALALLMEKLNTSSTEKQHQNINQIRKSQVGSGMRGDKIRTIRYQDGVVTNEINGKKISLKKYLSGDWDDFTKA